MLRGENHFGVWRHLTSSVGKRHLNRIHISYNSSFFKGGFKGAVQKHSIGGCAGARSCGLVSVHEWACEPLHETPSLTSQSESMELAKLAVFLE